MTNKIEKLNELKRKMFYLEMKDRWDASDYVWSRELNNEIIKLEKEIAEEQ